MYTEKYVIQTSSKSVNINQYIGNNKSLFIKIEIKRLPKCFFFLENSAWVLEGEKNSKTKNY